jgi:hypothetical protein
MNKSNNKPTIRIKKLSTSTKTDTSKSNRPNIIYKSNSSANDSFLSKKTGKFTISKPSKTIDPPNCTNCTKNLDFFDSRHEPFTCPLCGTSGKYGSVPHMADAFAKKSKFLSSVDNRLGKPITNSNSKSSFRFTARRCMVTVPGHIDKAAYTDFILQKRPDATVFVAHETAEKPDEGKHPYPHSHILINFDNCKSRPDFTDPHCFCLLGKHQCELDAKLDKGLRSHCNIVIPQDTQHWANMHLYICKEDTDNKDQLTSLHHSLTGFYNNVTSAPSLKAALSRPDILPSEILATKLCWDHKSTDFVLPDNYKKIDDLSLWQKWILNSLLTQSSLNSLLNRTITWIYDKVGRHGKSDFLKYCFQTLNTVSYDFHFIKSVKDTSVVASNIESALLQGWTGKFLIIDLARDANGNNLYESVEMILDGLITISRYIARSIKLPHNCIVAVFANCFPNFAKLSLDRWLLFDISDCDWNQLPFQYNVADWKSSYKQLTRDTDDNQDFLDEMDDQIKIYIAHKKRTHSFSSHSQYQKAATSRYSKIINNKILTSMQLENNRISWSFDPVSFIKQFPQYKKFLNYHHNKLALKEDKKKILSQLSEWDNILTDPSNVPSIVNNSTVGTEKTIIFTNTDLNGPTFHIENVLIDNPEIPSTWIITPVTKVVDSIPSPKTFSLVSAYKKSLKSSNK